MTAKTDYKYKIVDLTTGYYSSGGDIGFCYLSIYPTKEQILKEFSKVCTQIDRDSIDLHFDSVKIERKMGKMPCYTYIYLGEKAIGCLEPLEDR